MPERILRLGTRGSRLARWQADWVASQLRGAGRRVEVVEVRTEGDARQRGPIAAIGSVGVFTKELQVALAAGEIDLAVHSLKDLPTAAVAGLRLAAVPPRAPAADALITAGGLGFAALPRGARVGTGSHRRRAQLLYARPDLLVGDLRGNVETRLAKLDAGEHDAIVLAEAGLARLGLAGRITERAAMDLLLPAPAQGALGVECRDDDADTIASLAVIDDADTRAAVTAERAALARLEGGCLAAMGAHCVVADGRATLRVRVLDESGARRIDARVEGRADDAYRVGVEAADALLAQGAAALLRPRP